MALPIDDERREAILKDIRAGQKSRNAIAKEHGVSRATVTNIAKAAHVSDAFDRSNAQKGARARSFDAKERRRQAIEDLYDDFQRLRERAFGEYTQIVSGSNGPELLTTNVPSARDTQALMTTAAICLDKALQLEKHDDDSGAGVGKTMINDLFGALDLAYHQIIAEEEGEIDLTAPVDEPAADDSQGAVS